MWGGGHVGYIQAKAMVPLAIELLMVDLYPGCPSSGPLVHVGLFIDTALINRIELCCYALAVDETQRGPCCQSPVMNDAMLRGHREGTSKD